MEKVTITKAMQGTVTTRPLKNVKYTGQLMKKLAVQYAMDIAPFCHLSLIEFYDFVKNIPYVNDPKKEEFLQRPYYTITQRGKGGDCDDKAIVMGSYLYLSKIPFRFVACGKDRNGRLHHVIVEALIDNQWVHLDATYKFNTFGVPLYNYEKTLIISE